MKKEEERKEKAKSSVQMRCNKISLELSIFSQAFVEAVKENFQTPNDVRKKNRIASNQHVPKTKQY